jgi:hypothetical protein
MPVDKAPLLLLLLVLLCLPASAGSATQQPQRRGRLGRERQQSHGRAGVAALALVEEADGQLQRGAPLAAYEMAVAAAGRMWRTRPKVVAGKPPSTKALAWVRAQMTLGAACHTMLRFTEAVAHYGAALDVLTAGERFSRVEVSGWTSCD